MGDAISAVTDLPDGLHLAVNDGLSGGLISTRDPDTDLVAANGRLPHMSTEGTAVPVTAVGPDRFSLSNLVVIGVLMDLLADGRLRAAKAWMRAHTAFTPRPGSRGEPVTTLVVWPYGQPDEATLRAALSDIEASLTRRTGYSDDASGGWARTPLRLELRSGAEHPGPVRRVQIQGLLDDVSDLVEEPSWLQALDELRVALDRATIGTAFSAGCGIYDVFVLADSNQEERERITSAVWLVDKAIHAGRKRKADLSRFNNLSPVTADVDLTAIRATQAVDQEPERRLSVGVITPGGSAASRDVLGKLEQLDGIALHQQVVPRSAAALNSAMVRAADTLFDEQPDAIVAGYGGGRREDLDPLVGAMQGALGHRTVPMYVAVGHRDYDRRISSPRVRMCATPADAAELFRVEMIEVPQRRADLVRRAYADLRAAVGDPRTSQNIAERLRTELEAAEADLRRALERHLQPDE